MKDQKDKNFSIIKETQIAGLKFCIGANSKFEKIFWILLGILGLAGSFTLFYFQIQSWNMNAILSTRKLVDLSKLKLPAITFCHQGNTRTEIADRLMQAADESSPKLRQLRSLILKLSFEFMIESQQNMGYPETIQGYYNNLCFPSTGRRCEDCICKNFNFGYAYGKENKLTMKQLYEKIFVDVVKEDNISIGLAKIGAEIDNAK